MPHDETPNPRNPVRGTGGPDRGTAGDEDELLSVNHGPNVYIGPDDCDGFYRPTDAECFERRDEILASVLAGDDPAPWCFHRQRQLLGDDSCEHKRVSPKQHERITAAGAQSNGIAVWLQCDRCWHTSPCLGATGLHVRPDLGRGWFAIHTSAGIHLRRWIGYDD